MWITLYRKSVTVKCLIARIAGEFCSNEFTNYVIFLASVVYDWWCAFKDRQDHLSVISRAPWCSVIHLCCLALVLSSLTSVSLVLLLHGKTHLEYCLMRVASPNLVRNNGRGHRTRHEVFYGAVLQQGCKVWICFLAICGFHLHQLGSNIQIFSVHIANISLRLGFLSEGCLPMSLESQPPFPSTLHSLNASSPVNANSPTAFCIPKWYEE